MQFMELEPFKATCMVTQEDMISFGITPDDIFERTARGYEFIHMAKELTKKSTKQEWPGCAFSMQIAAYQNGDIALTFSETVEDFIQNLEHSRNIAPEQSDILDQLIQELKTRDEDGARNIIRQFEKNVAAMRES